MNKLWSLAIAGLLFVIIISITLDIIDDKVVFSLNGEESYTISVNTNYEDIGYSAFLFNNDISNRVKINNNLDTSRVGVYYIDYYLDYLKSEYNLRRTINVVDTEEPVIKLNGESEISLYVGDTYQELGAIAIDNYDGDMTSDIIISGNVNTSNVGTYEIVYSVKDSSGNENSIVRKVIVNKKIVKPMITYNCVKYSDNYSDADEIIKYIKENNYRVSVGYYNLVTGLEYFYQANKIYYGASLLKTLDAIYIYDKNMVNDKTRGWIEKAISISDNDSHYYLYNYIGIDNLRNYGRSLGACNTLSGTDNYGNTTVSDQVVYLKKLYEISKNNSELQSYFINDYGNYLKFDDTLVMHKYGYYGGYYHDVGIVLDEQPYIIVVLTEHGESSFKYQIINNISKLINEYHNSNK